MSAPSFGGTSFCILDSSDQRKKEFQEVYRIWINEQKNEPEVYIKQRMNSEHVEELNFSSMKKLSIKDFKTKQTITINGLVLSKFEAAIIASFGSSSLKVL